jgi:glycosyltransferase involved in cell wall biosynthesis
MQQTSFPFDVIIGDDASPDGTVDILLEYKNRYPNKITLILRQDNVGATRNICDCMARSSGDYLTILEGDDFWTDPGKLQKQVDFLEAHPEYVGVSHTTSGIDGEGAAVPTYDWKNIVGSINMRQFLRGRTFSNNACVYRNVFRGSRHDVIWKAHRMIAEHTIGMLLLDKGDIYTLNEPMSVYRMVRSPKGNNYSSTPQAKQYLERMEVFRTLESYFEHRYSFRQRYVSYSVSFLLIAIKEGWLPEFSRVFNRLPASAKATFFLTLPQNVLKTVFRKFVKQPLSRETRRVYETKISPVEAGVSDSNSGVPADSAGGSCLNQTKTSPGTRSVGARIRKSRENS